MFRTLKQQRRLHPLLLLLAFLLLVGPGCRTEQEAVPAVLVRTPPPDHAPETLLALNAATIPERDLVSLAERLGGQVDVPQQLADAPTYRQDDTAKFFVVNHDTNAVDEVSARLVYRSEGLNMWFASGDAIDRAVVQQAAQVIETEILPRNRGFFGSEWQPGIDGDPRLNILHLDALGQSIVGYFSAADEFSRLVNPFSNERELLYISLDLAPVGTPAYYEVIAHEFQHMIHWYADNNESTWLNEGMSVLAGYLNGYPGAGYERAFAANPDVQLTGFSYDGAKTAAHYGAAFYLSAYFLDRFGEEATQLLVEHPENGSAGVQAALADLGTDLTFDGLFADWVVANYLDSIDRGQDVLQYRELDVESLSPAGRVSRIPSEESSDVQQFGADYIELNVTGPATLTFTGTQQVPLLATDPHSGDYFWTTVPADNSDMTLTRSFDLSGLTEATLTFWTWYDIEEGWDYAYVTVSNDGGESWELLETTGMTRENPQGNSYGPAFTGLSGTGNEPNWVQQTADLTPYVGAPIQLRFEYVTDDAIHRAGWAIDDIAIPQLDFADTVEQGAGEWQAAGFVRHANVLPQTFLIQLLRMDDDHVKVERLELDINRRGEWQILPDDATGEAVLIISAITPFTSAPAAYQYSLRR